MRVIGDRVNVKGFWLAAISIVLVSAAQLLMKFGTMSLTDLNDIEFSLSGLHLLLNPAVILPITAAGILYFLSVFSWVKTLGHLPLSVAYPLLSLSYPLVHFGAVMSASLAETPSVQRSIGLALIILGVAVASRNTK